MGAFFEQYPPNLAKLFVFCRSTIDITITFGYVWLYKIWKKWKSFPLHMFRASCIGYWQHYGRFGLIFFQFQVLLVYLALQKLQNRNEKYKRNLSDVCQSWGNALRFILYTWKHSLEGTVTWKRPKKQQNWRYLNYWQSYRVEKGT